MKSFIRQRLREGMSIGREDGYLKGARTSHIDDKMKRIIMDLNSRLQEEYKEQSIGSFDFLPTGNMSHIWVLKGGTRLIKLSLFESAEDFKFRTVYGKQFVMGMAFVEVDENGGKVKDIIKRDIPLEEGILEAPLDIILEFYNYHLNRFISEVVKKGLV